MRSNAKSVFKKLQNNLEATIKESRKEMGETAIKHFKKSFSIEGFNNIPFMHWRHLKKPRPAPYMNNKILHKTGTLKNSLRYTTRPIKNAYTVKVYTTVPYAAVHNSGLRSGKGKGFKMPKRQFIGYSKTLEKQLAKTLAFRLRKFK